MTKRLLAALTALLLCFCLPACGGGEESSAPLPDGITTAVTTAVSTAPATTTAKPTTTTTTTTAIQATTSRTWSHEELYGSWKPTTTTAPKVENPAEGRVKVWGDEFEGDSIDMTKWKFHRTMSTPEDRTYDNSELYADVTNGKLTMTVLADENGNLTLSEGITTRERMAFRYGYLEISARPPFKQGAWPSFWMQTDPQLRKANYMAEVDIYEVFSSKDTVVANIHKWGNGEHTMIGLPASRVSYTFKPAQLAKQYHRYGFEWTPEEMRFFVDGVCFSTMSIREKDDFDKTVIPGMDGFHDFSYVIFNNEFFTRNNSWDSALNVNYESTWPQIYQIDWIRLYQKPGEEIYIYD